MKLYDEEGNQVLVIQEKNNNDVKNDIGILGLIDICVLIMTCVNTYMVYKIFVTFNKLSDYLNQITNTINSILN